MDALTEEIGCTSGATESKKRAVRGAVKAAKARGEARRRLVTLAVEHASVLGPIQALEQRGCEVIFAPLDSDGRVSPQALSELLNGALLLSVQAANNETGVIQPLPEVCQLASERGVLVHVDAAQILGKAPFSVERLNLDFVSLSAHKCYGPNGVGALWVRGGPASPAIAPLIFGGDHERSLRPGTPNAPGIAGFGLAATLAVSRLAEDAKRIGALRDRLEGQIRERIRLKKPGDNANTGRIRINGAGAPRLPGATSITFPGLDADALVANLPELQLSTASACHGGGPEPSHVLRAMGLTRKDAYATVRLGLGIGLSAADVDYAAARITAAASRLWRANNAAFEDGHEAARSMAGAMPARP